MALLGNYSVLTKNPGRAFGGNSTTSVALGGPGALGGEAQYRSNSNKSGPARGMFVGQGGIDQKNAKPNGYKPGYGATVIQIKGGGMASYGRASGFGSASNVNLAGVKEAVAALGGEGFVTVAALGGLGYVASALSGSGLISGAAPTGLLGAIAGLVGSGDLEADVTALVDIYAEIEASGLVTGDVAAIKSILANLSGSGSLDAEIEALTVLLAVADLSGSGTVSEANVVPIALIVANLIGEGAIDSANLAGSKEAVAALIGSGNLTAASNALASLISSLSGLGSATGTGRGMGHIGADITPFTDLSPQNLAAAVWNEPQSSYDRPGTFGDNLDAPVSSIGGGSITEEGIAEAVWDEMTSAHVTDGTYGALMKKLLTVSKFLGLK